MTTAIYEAGYNSSGRFYSASKGLLGMKPSDYKNGGSHTEIRFATAPCSLGRVLVASTSQGICAIFLGDKPEPLLADLARRFPKASIAASDRKFGALLAKVVKVIESPGTGTELPFDIRGTVFQERVWRALQKIPMGTTATYAEIARQIAAPKSFRAVAQACGANPVAVLVPCHRVVRTDGDLSGYRWGIERKRALLEREQGATKPDKPFNRIKR